MESTRIDEGHELRESSENKTKDLGVDFYEVDNPIGSGESS